MYLFLFIIILVFLFSFAYGSYEGAPWVPSRSRDIKRFLKLAEIKPGQKVKVYDLGCGDGRIICSAAKEGAIAEGFEISLLPYLLAKIRSFFLKDKKNYKVRYKNFWSVDLSEADVVYLFLTKEIHSKFKIKLEKELKQGAKIICYVWPIEGWKPLKIDTVEGHPNLYLYQI